MVRGYNFHYPIDSHPMTKFSLTTIAVLSAIANFAAPAMAETAPRSASGYGELHNFHIPIWGLRVTEPTVEVSRQDFGAGQAKLRVTPASLEFSTVGLGETTDAQRVTFQNVGLVDLSLGQAYASLGYLAGTECNGLTLKPGAKCTVTAKFSPEIPGVSENAQLSMPFESQGFNAVANIDVAGEGTLDFTPEPTVVRLTSSSKLDFGVVDLNQTSTRVLTVWNTGGKQVTGMKITAPAAPYSLSKTTCTATLDIGKSCEITVSVRPTKLYETLGVLKVSAGNLTTPAKEVTVRAEAHTRTITVSPTSLPFGTKNIATVSAPTLLTITNTGTIATKPSFVNRRGIGATDTGPGANSEYSRWGSNVDWLLVHPSDCQDAIPVGGSCTVRIAVQPPAVQSYSTSQAIVPAQGMTTGAVTVAASVTGTKQAFSHTPAQFDVGALAAGQVYQGVVTIKNTSLDNATLTGFSVQFLNPKNGVGSIENAGSTCGSSLTFASSTCEIRFKLTGATVSAESMNQQALIKFNYSGANSDFTVIPVNFSNLASQVQLSADNLDFGDVPTGVSAANAPRRGIRVFNASAAPVTFSAATFSAFGLHYKTTLAVDATASTCKFNTAIAPQTSCEFKVYPVVPTAAGLGRGDIVAQLHSQSGTTVHDVGSSQRFVVNVVQPTFVMTTEGEHIHETGDNTTTSTSFTYSFGKGNTADVRFTGTLRPEHSLSESCNSSTGLCTVTLTSVPTESPVPEVVYDYEVFTSHYYTKGNSAENIPAPTGVKKRIRIKTEPLKLALDGASSIDFGTITAFNIDKASTTTKYVIVKNVSKYARLGAKLSIPQEVVTEEKNTIKLSDGSSVSACSSSRSVYTVLPGKSCAVELRPNPANYNGEYYTGAAVIDADASNTELSIPINARLTGIEKGKLEVTTGENFDSVVATGGVTELKLYLKNTGRGILNFRPMESTSIAQVVKSNDDFITLNTNSLGSWEALSKNFYHTKTASNSDPNATNCDSVGGLNPGSACYIPIYVQAALPTGIRSFTLTVPTFNADAEIFSKTFEYRVKAPLFEPTFGGVKFPIEFANKDIYRKVGKINLGSFQTLTPIEVPFSIKNVGDAPGAIYMAQAMFSPESSYSLTSPGRETLPDAIPHPAVSTSDCIRTLQPGEECSGVITYTSPENRNLDTYERSYYLNMVSRWGEGFVLQLDGSIRYSESTVRSKLFSWFSFGGTASGSKVTLSNASYQIPFVVENGAGVDIVKVTDVELSAVGSVGFKLLKLLPATQGFVGRLGSCQLNVLYKEGDTCKMEVWTTGAIPYTSTLSKQDLPVLLATTIGEQVDADGNSLRTDGTIAITLKSNNIVSGVLQNVVAKPSVLSRNRMLNVDVRAQGLQPNAVMVINGEEVPGVIHVEGTTRFSGFMLTGEMGTEFPVRNPYGIAKTLNAIFGVTDDNMLFAGELSGAGSVTASVSDTDASTLIYGSTPLPQGGALSVIGNPATNAPELILSDVDGSTKGRITGLLGGFMFDMKDTGSSGSIGKAAFTATGTPGEYLVHLVAATEGSGGGAREYRRDSWRISVSGTEVTGSRIRSKVDLVSLGNWESNKQIGGVQVSANSAEDYVLGFTTAPVTAWTSVIEGKHQGTPFSTKLPSGFPRVLHGLAKVGTSIFARSGDSIYSYTLDPATSTLTGGVRYQYPGVLSATGGEGLIYDAVSGALLTSCFEGASVCTIAQASGALGIANPTLGANGTKGRNDGLRASATYNFKQLVKVDPSLSWIGEVSQSPDSPLRVHSWR